MAEYSSFFIHDGKHAGHTEADRTYAAVRFSGEFEFAVAEHFCCSGELNVNFQTN